MAILVEYTQFQQRMKFFRSTQIDGILSSSPPATCHLIARSLKEKYHIPWVADFRDLWTQNHYYSHTPDKKLCFERKLELSIISRVSAITTTTRPFADKLKELHKTNLFFPFQMGMIDIINPGVHLDDRFLIIYAGNLAENETHLPLFKVISDLLNQGIINQNRLKN